MRAAAMADGGFGARGERRYGTECPEGKNGKGNGSAGKKPNPFNKGQVNHINVEEGAESPLSRQAFALLVANAAIGVCDWWRVFVIAVSH